MKVENFNYGNAFGKVEQKEQWSEAKQSERQETASRNMTDDAVSMEISKRGFAMAQELEAFDGEEVYHMRTSLTAGIDSSSIIHGAFAGTVAENYKSLADRIRETYSGDEYERQMGILDKAFREASESLSNQYAKQMRILSGDIVINRTVNSYPSQEAAENALAKDDSAQQKKVISEEKEQQISSDVKILLEAAKNSVLTKGVFDWSDLQNAATSGFNHNDLQKMGAFLLDKKHQ